MKILKAFSLLEVVLATAILGLTLPFLLSIATNGIGDTNKKVKTVAVLNAKKNLENFTEKIVKSLDLNENMTTYFGIKDGQLKLSKTLSFEENDLFILKRLEEREQFGSYIASDLYSVSSSKLDTGEAQSDSYKVFFTHTFAKNPR